VIEMEDPKNYKPLTETEIDATLADKKAIFNGHFIYTKGGHGDKYVDKSEITFWPEDTGILCKDIAFQWYDKNIEVVVGPAIGGIILANRVAEWLTNFTGREIPALYTEKENGKQVLKRGRDKIAGKNVLIVKDITNTGKSAEETISACSEAGANIIGCHALVNRSPGIVTSQTLGVPIFLALKEMEVANYPEEKCPLCAKKVPINTDRGHGAEYLKKNPEKAKWGKE
jgi:orotate phosphoribosyltransferase